MHFRRLALAGLAALGASALVVACVSLDGVASGGSADAADATTAVEDSGVDVGEVPSSTPGQVQCGPMRCTLPSTCCASLPMTTGGPIATTCQAATDTCAGYAITCDERADCAKTESCCFGLGDGGDSRAACARTCLTIQACRTDAECLGGKTCEHLTCFGLRLWVCGPNAFCSAN